MSDRKKALAMPFVRSIPILALVLAFAGCAGSHGSSALPSMPTQAAKGSGTAAFVIKIPAKTSATNVRPQYVSPATQSMTIDISGPTEINETANLTIGSSGCASSLASVVCTLTISGLQPGSYTATLTTYDQTGGTGNVLSAAQEIAFTIVAGQTNTISLTLSGVPVETIIAANDSFAQASGSGGYDLVGQGARTFIVESLDADDDIIAGPGAPTFTLSQTSGALGVTIPSSTSSSAPNTFTITPPAAYSSATATVSATPTFAGQTTNGCAQTGASCTAATVTVGMAPFVAMAGASCCNIAVDPAINRIYVSSASQTTVVDGSAYSVVTTISGGGGVGNVDSSTDDFWLATLYSGSAEEYSGSTDTLLATVGLADCPVATWVDSANRYVWVAAQCGSGSDPVWAVDADTAEIIDGPIGTGGVMGVTVVNSATGTFYVNNSAGNFEVNPSTFALTSTAFGTVIAANAVANMIYGQITDGLNIISGGTTTGSEAIQTTISLSYTPAFIAVNTSLNHLYIGESGGTFIDVYNATTGVFLKEIQVPSGMTVTSLAADSTRDLIYAFVTLAGSDYLYGIVD